MDTWYPVGVTVYEGSGTLRRMSLAERGGFLGGERMGFVRYGSTPLLVRVLCFLVREAVNKPCCEPPLLR